MHNTEKERVYGDSCKCKRRKEKPKHLCSVQKKLAFPPHYSCRHRRAWILLSQIVCSATSCLEINTIFHALSHWRKYIRITLLSLQPQGTSPPPFLERPVHVCFVGRFSKIHPSRRLIEPFCSSCFYVARASRSSPDINMLSEFCFKTLFRSKAKTCCHKKWMLWNKGDTSYAGSVAKAHLAQQIR